MPNRSATPIAFTRPLKDTSDDLVLFSHGGDLNIDVPDIAFDNLDVLRIAGEPHPVRPVAQRSISNRLGIPYPYLRRCPPDVQALNLNHWITKEKNEKLLFRFDGQDVRALFTTKYIPVDNFEVWNVWIL